MASIAELIDAFASKVEDHAKLPAGSAAAAAAAVAMRSARFDLLQRYAEEVGQTACLRNFLLNLKNQIETSMP